MAHRDLKRLPAFLDLKSASAAEKARRTLVSALDVLGQFPLRGRIVGPGLRELAVRFGRDAYLLRYRASETEVLVTRIRHSRERR